MQVKIRPYSKKELANLYGISYYVLNGWLKHLGKRLGEYITHMYNINQVKLIFEALGVPGQEIIID